MGPAERQGGRARRLALLEVALPLAFLLAVEVAVRVYVASTAEKPVPRLFPFPITTGKYLAYAAHASEPLDVLLFGLSQMQRASARMVEEAVAGTGHSPVRVFNFAAPLQSVEFSRRLLQDVLLPIRRPRVIVYGLMPTSFLYEWRLARVERTIRTLPVFADTPVGRLRWALLRRSELLLYRDVLRERFLGWPSGEVENWLRMARETDARGDVPWPIPARPVTGLMAHEQENADRLRNFDRLLKRGDMFKHLARFAALCRAEGIRLVVVNSAVHPLFARLLPSGTVDYRRFVARLRQVAARLDVPFLDLGDDDYGPAELFFDTVHHNDDGSRWLSERIGVFLATSGVLDG